MANNEINNPHDKIFRAAMQYKEVACEFLEMHLPEDIKKIWISVPLLPAQIHS